jgi:hypothetical protein
MAIEAARRWGAEILLALVAGAGCLGFLGSTELWGKRDQRASAGSKSRRCPAGSPQP